MKKFRRVVTGFNKDGKSCVKWDNEIEPVTLRPGFDNIPLWATKDRKSTRLNSSH